VVNNIDGSEMGGGANEARENSMISCSSDGGGGKTVISSR